MAIVNYTCLDLPLGSYSIDSFATYSERKLNPTQKDLLFFNITKVALDYIEGFVLPVDETKNYSFIATCKQAFYDNFHELILDFEADSMSKVNKCSGVFNFKSKETFFPSALYLGCRSLITGDPYYHLCEQLRYGTFIPPYLS